MVKSHVELTETDKDYLESLLKKGSLKSRTFKRALALLELNKGKTYGAVGMIVDFTYNTVSTLAGKYNTIGLDCLGEKPRTGRPKGISGEEIAKITAVACTKPPEGHARWSLRLLADKVVELSIVEDISHVEVGRILKKTNCSLIEKDNGALQS
jgi:putative transposase